MIIGSVDYPEPLLTALRNGELVVFAGAGVSMGHPSKLPSFAELACEIGKANNVSKNETETDDQFLGRLQASIDVHKVAVDLLTRGIPEPTEMHRNILRLYKNENDIRIVTTNFDTLFEQVSSEGSNLNIKVFEAPALPLGERFRGIVHLHGSVVEPSEMVLTDSDFGRVYLTENEGWARRFLVEMFSNFTVLFIGYSHNDTILSYMARALPVNALKRYALVGKLDSDVQQWQALGINSVVFEQTAKGDFGRLHDSIHALSDHMQRGILDWQFEITAIANNPPPVDEESIGIIEYALTDPRTTRFFVESARHPQWVGWLFHRGYLSSIFAADRLSELDAMLSLWLASSFTRKSPDTLFQLISRHGTNLKPDFWAELVRAISASGEENIDPGVLSRWVSLLANTAQQHPDVIFFLTILAEACIKERLWDGALQIYSTLISSRLTLIPGAFPDEVQEGSVQLAEVRPPSEHWLLERLCGKSFHSHMERLAEPLLRLTTRAIEEQHQTNSAWQRASRTWDEFDSRRPAIGSDWKNPFPDFRDAMIDVVRNSLDWLAENREDKARGWMTEHADSEVPVLRRLAIYTLSLRTDLIADEKLKWLLNRRDLHSTTLTYEETFRVAIDAYPESDLSLRESFIAAVMSCRSSESESDKENHLSLSHQLNWLNVLKESSPTCSLVRKELEDLLGRHPDLEPSERTKRPHVWTAEELLAKSPSDWLIELAEHETDESSSGARNRSVSAVEQAVRGDWRWGLGLADAMANDGVWDDDLWNGIVRAWSDENIDPQALTTILRHLANKDLHDKFGRAVVDVLYSLSQNSGLQNNDALLTKANDVAAGLQDLFDSTPSALGMDEWLTKAINHPAGKLAQFWVQSLSIWCKSQELVPEAFSPEYRAALSKIVKKEGLSGKLGRTILAGYFTFLLATDETWTRTNILPLFDEESSDFQAAWDGFLMLGRITPAVAELLEESFILAVQHINDKLGGEDRQRLFIDRYTSLLDFLSRGPSDRWITALMSVADLDVRKLFAMYVGHSLRNTSESNQQSDRWERWLKGYWVNRLNGIPKLEDAEIALMLEWTLYLPSAFPEAVDLAIKMPHASLEYTPIFRRINESELVDRYPHDMARLLVHLGNCEASPTSWFGTRTTVDRLLELELTPDLVRGLKELIAVRNLK